MDFNTACMNLNINSPFSKEKLKKQYRIMALKNHPDKHPDNIEHYTEKFKEIGQSYEFLNNLNINDDNSNNSNDNSSEINSNYNDIFIKFLSTIFTNNYSDVKDIINTIIGDCQNISIKIFENMDKEKSIKFFEFINKYKDILHIPRSTVDKINNIINEKIINDNIIIINPSLDDLINDNIYILDFETEKYYVPLWHDEIYYKHKESDLIIKCMPDLPENISLDNDNNIIIEIKISIQLLLNYEYYPYKLGTQEYSIPINELRIKKKQSYILKQKGISLINNSNMYDNSLKSNIIFIIQLI